VSDQPLNPDALMARIRELEDQMPRMISMKDRLPEKQCNVLVVVNSYREYPQNCNPNQQVTEMQNALAEVSLRHAEQSARIDVMLTEAGVGRDGPVLDIENRLAQALAIVKAHNKQVSEYEVLKSRLERAMDLLAMCEEPSDYEKIDEWRWRVEELEKEVAE
jgi:hypothetical protein